MHVSDLRTRIRDVTRAALDTGALVPLATRPERCFEPPFSYHLRVALTRRGPAPGPVAAVRRNPFLPFEPDLHVGDVGPDHAVILNKFKVLDDHAYPFFYSGVSATTVSGRIRVSDEGRRGES